MTTTGALEQSRIGDFEDPTDDYAVVDLAAQYFFSAGGVLHTVHVGVDNVGNSEYRDHLSRVKSIMPEPGRNFKVLHRVFLKTPPPIPSD